MEQVYLPGKIRDRLQDLLKSRKITQAELAARSGCMKSLISRFISGKTEKLSDDNLNRIAQALNVSTDFLLGESDVPDRMNYDIAELGLTVQAARNLYTQKANPVVVSCLLENEHFARATWQMMNMLNNEIAQGVHVVNQMLAFAGAKLSGFPEAQRELSALQTPVYQHDLHDIEDSFMQAVREIKKQVGALPKPSDKTVLQIMKQTYDELNKGQNAPRKSVSVDDVAEAISHVAATQLDANPSAVQDAFRALVQSVVKPDEQLAPDQ